MTDIISATTRFGRTVTTLTNRRDDFVVKAQRLVAQADAALSRKDYAEALELSYQAALRLAGARTTHDLIESGRVTSARTRSSGKGSAWDQLRKVDDQGEAQAERFGSYSTMRSRALSGIDPHVDPLAVQRLRHEVGCFLAEVEAEVGWTSMAA